MRFNGLDLNLLVALDALLQVRSITAAAERLHLSQSATSNALTRLREYFEDELLVQVGRKMELTPRAEGLKEAVRDVLVRIDSTIGLKPEFVPSKSDRTFRIFASDYTLFVFMPHLLALAAQQEFSGQFDLLAQVSNPQRDLERGEADLLIIPSVYVSPDHPSQVLYEEHFVCAMWRQGRLAKGELTLERYLAARHLVMRPARTDIDSFEAWSVQRLGIARRVAARSYSFTAMAGLVVGTEHIATLQARLARRLLSSWPLVLKPAPLPLSKMEQAIQWHKYRTQDPGLCWLRELMRQAVERMDAEADR